MKEVRFDLEDGRYGKVMIPSNCKHPFIYPRPECNAVNPNNPECDCRWCVFNAEYKQAKQKDEEV